MAAAMSKEDSLKKLSGTPADKPLCQLAQYLLTKCDRQEQTKVYNGLRTFFENNPGNPTYQFINRYMKVDDIVEMQWLFATGVQIAANASADYIPTLIDSGSPRQTGSIASYDTETDDLSTLTPIGITHYILTKYADRLTTQELRNHFLPKRASFIKDRIETGIEEYRHMVQFKDPKVHEEIVAAMKTKYGENWMLGRNIQQAIAHGTQNNEVIAAFQRDDPAEIDAEQFKQSVETVTNKAVQMYTEALKGIS